MIDINYANLKVFARLVRHGFATEKQIVSMGIGDLTRIPKISAAEIRGINDFQQAIKTGKTLSFFIEETNEQPTTVEAEGQENDET